MNRNEEIGTLLVNLINNGCIVRLGFDHYWLGNDGTLPVDTEADDYNPADDYTGADSGNDVLERLQAATKDFEENGLPAYSDD